MNKFYSTGEVSEILGVLPRQVRRIAEDLGCGKLHGGIWTFSEKDVRKMERRKKTPGKAKK